MTTERASPGVAKKKADLKVVILGDAYVGKTCLIRRYMDGIFYSDIPNTVGAAFFLKQYGASNVAIWDTAGEEKFAGLSSFYCRRASAAIVAYDIGSEESFLSIDNRYVKLLEAVGDNCTMVLVGTKLDLIDAQRHRRITRERAVTKVKQLSEQWQSKAHPRGTVPYFETSAKTGEGVAEVFDFIFETIVPMMPRQTAPRLDLTDKTKPQRTCHKSNTCC